MSQPEFPLDDLDVRILRTLQHDASLSNAALAERVHASAPTCLRRVRRLREAGLIQRQIALLDAARLGATLTAIIEITLDRRRRRTTPPSRPISAPRRQ